MTYQQLIDREFLSLTPTFDEVQMHLLQLAHSVPAEKLELSLSITSSSVYVSIFHVGETSRERVSTIEFRTGHTCYEWMESIEEIRCACLTPTTRKPTQIEILEEMLIAEKLEVIRLRNLIKLNGNQAV